MELLRKDNERRARSFNSAVDAAIANFRADLEAQRDSLQAKLDSAGASQEEAAQHAGELASELVQARSLADQHAAKLNQVEADKAQVEGTVAGLREERDAALRMATQAAASLEEKAAAQKEVEAQLSAAQSQLEDLTAQLAQAMAAAAAATAAEENSRQEADRLKALADKASENMQATAAAQAAVSAHARLNAIAETGAAKARIQELEAEVAAMKAGSGQRGWPARSSAVSGDAILNDLGVGGINGYGSSLDLEALRSEPLLPSSGPARKGAAERRASSGTRDSKLAFKMMVGYLGIIHVLLMVSLRTTRAHHCEDVGTLP